MYACRTMAVGRVDELRTRGLTKNRPCFIFPNINILIINIYTILILVTITIIIIIIIMIIIIIIIMETLLNYFLF